MIWALLFKMILLVLTIPFAFLPHALSLPFGVDAFTTSMVAAWYGFLTVAWPLQAMWNCFLLFIPIQLVLIVMKVFLGSRLPEF